MAQIITMAKHYRKRPSEILNINNDYAAYCFDEVAFYLQVEATDKEGNLDWSKINWVDNVRTNKDFMNFLEGQGR